MTFKRLLIAIVLAVVSFGAGAYIRFNTITVPEPRPAAPRDHGTGSDTGAETPTEGDRPITIDDGSGDDDFYSAPLNIAGRINILVLGEDNIEAVKRSDTMLFVAIDVDKRNVRVLSLPRDTRVAIPRHGNQKLNHAYAYGGIDLLRATIERFLGTTIHYYVKIDYDNFPRLVDIIGGVDIFVGRAMKYTDRKQKLFIDIPQGKQRMNGETALKYVRFRNDAMGDIGRIRRQQQFLKAFLHRIYETENLLQFPSIMNEIKNTLATDMEPSTILQLGSFVRRLENEQNRIFFKMLPGEPAIVDGLSYWIAKQSSIEAFLKADIEGLSNTQSDVSTAADFSPDTPEGRKTESTTLTADAPSTAEIQKHIGNIEQAIAILNGTGKAGIAHGVSTHLQKMGIDVTHVGNAKHFDYKNSMVIYPEKATQDVKQTAEALADLCGISPSLTRADRQAAYPSLVLGHNYETLVKRLENSYATIQ